MVWRGTGKVHANPPQTHMRILTLRPGFTGSRTSRYSGKLYQVSRIDSSPQNRRWGCWNPCGCGRTTCDRLGGCLAARRSSRCSLICASRDVARRVVTPPTSTPGLPPPDRLWCNCRPTDSVCAHSTLRAPGQPALARMAAPGRLTHGQSHSTSRTLDLPAPAHTVAPWHGQLHPLPPPRTRPPHASPVAATHPTFSLDAASATRKLLNGQLKWTALCKLDRVFTPQTFCAQSQPMPRRPSRSRGCNLHGRFAKSLLRCGADSHQGGGRAHSVAHRLSFGAPVQPQRRWRRWRRRRSTRCRRARTSRAPHLERVGPR
jgi:hypothetical protein